MTEVIITESPEIITIEVNEGVAGLSAYEIAVVNGFIGSESEWLASLVGGGNTASGIVEIDFGLVPTDTGSISVAGQTNILATSKPHAFFSGRVSSDTLNDSEAHKFAGLAIKLVCSEPTPGIGFTIYAYCLIGKVTGKFKIDYIWS